MKISSKRDRRRFIAETGLGLSSLMIVPAHVLGRNGDTAPSDKLNIAGIGVGGRGADDLREVEGENIVALADVDWNRAAKTFQKYPNAKQYKDYREMLDKQKDIEAVIVATPDHVHAFASMAAIQLGKHVYCEKPLTHTIEEARKLTEAARNAKVATQMGIQGHSYEGIRLIAEWIWDGAIGPVREVHCWTDRPAGWWPQGVDRPKDMPPVPATLDWDLWIGPAPTRPYNPAYVPFKWRGWWDFGCGALGDMGCHIFDSPFFALKLGYPTEVEAVSSPVNKETGPVASIVRYRFPARGDMPPVTLTWYDGGLLPPRPDELEPGRRLGNENGGILYIGDKGKIMASDENAQSPCLIPQSKMNEYKRPPKSIPRSIGHHAEWVQACKGGQPGGANFDYAGPLTEVVLLGNVVIRAGEKTRRLQWDGQGMKCTNVDTANHYVRNDYRQGWSLS